MRNKISALKSRVSKKTELHSLEDNIKKSGDAAEKFFEHLYRVMDEEQRDALCSELPKLEEEVN